MPPPLRSNAGHAVDALLLEKIVADAEDLVHDEQIRLDVCGDREAEPCVHPGRVSLHGRINELAQSAEINDFVEFARISSLVMPRMVPFK